MKLAFSTLGCPDYSVDEVIQAAVSYGYGAVSIRTIAGTTDLLSLPAFQSNGLARTRRAFEESGVEVLCLSTGVKFNSENSSELNSQLDDGKQYVELAAALSAPYIRIFGGDKPEHRSLAEAAAQLADWTTRLAEYAEEGKVRILLELHDDYATGERAKLVLDRCKSANVGIIWDIQHSLREGESFQRTWERIGPNIYNVHIKDVEQNGTPRGYHVLCGEGSLPIEEIVAMLRAEGYDGYFEFESEKAWHPEIPAPEVALPHYVDYMKSLEERLR